MDTNIQYIIAGTAFAAIQLLGIIVVMSQVAWQVFIIFIPVITACIWYQVNLAIQKSSSPCSCVVYNMKKHVKFKTW